MKRRKRKATKGRTASGRIRKGYRLTKGGRLTQVTTMKRSVHGRRRRRRGGRR